jgi:hypothetical protein
MDLPAYDPVRSLTSAQSQPLLMREKVLMLCPFTDGYKQKNWPQIEQHLLGTLKRRFGSEHLSLARLLDEETPRLVVQTLYELIRRADMCVVDWTGLRPNVLFELGVRLAVNRLGAVHIQDTDPVAKREQKNVDARNALSHVRHMKSLFAPIPYSSLKGSSGDFEAMVKEYEENYDNPRPKSLLVYRTVGENLGAEPDRGKLTIVKELLERANLLSSTDPEGSGISSVLYHDVSSNLLSAARSAAIERRIAAWLYLDAAHSDEEFLADVVLSDRFRALGTEIRAALSQQRINAGDLSKASERIENRIRQRLTGLRRAAMQPSAPER